MMKPLHVAQLVLGAMLISRVMPASAQQPPDTVDSDAFGNTAMGTSALISLTPTATTGLGNTAAGLFALFTDSTGGGNTAMGYQSLALNADGTNNSAVGYAALYSNSAGNFNTAMGVVSLETNATGSSNTAVGFSAMNANVSGANNTAFGANALTSNSTGKGNAAQGVNALYSNTTGIRNLGIGSNALYENLSGSYNLALGFDAGYNSVGNDNIYLNNQGDGGDSQVMRLGTDGTSGEIGSGILTTFIAGVATSQVTGSAVYVTATGQLGVLASSERFKTDIQSIQNTSEKLAQLRPVSFKLKTDPNSATQYGLIAEEVAKVYPEMVIHGADGRIDGVRYEELAPLLLREAQQQRQQIAKLNRTIETESQREIQAATLQRIGMADMQRQIIELKQANQAMQAALEKLSVMAPRMAMQ